MQRRSALAAASKKQDLCSDRPNPIQTNRICVQIDQSCDKHPTNNRSLYFEFWVTYYQCTVDHPSNFVTKVQIRGNGSLQIRWCPTTVERDSTVRR